MKRALRELFKQRRSQLSSDRRSSARLALTKWHIPYHYVLSFSSLPEEISLHQLNQHLASQKRLLLPRIEGDNITPYLIVNLEHTTLNEFGILEPDPTLCVKQTHLDAILVPALAFDTDHHRIGYGKGFYDRFLLTYPNIPHIGIGFKEQITDYLPHEPHDIALTELKLF